jgi:peroxiredoxin
MLQRHMFQVVGKVGTLRWMNGLLIAAGALVALILSAGSWLGWQLVRQNGRLLLRLEELERRLNELEFGEGEEPVGLPVGSDAPAFELADLAGERRSLAQYRGQPLVLLFFNPDCGYCREMAPKLAQHLSEGRALRVPDSLHGQENQGLVELGPPSKERPRVLILTTGDAERNREFFAGNKLDCPVLLQNDGEVAKVYQAHGTPSGYLISPEGKIASKLAMGAEALLGLATELRSSRGNEAQTEKYEIRNPKPEIAESLLTSAATSDGEGRASRFSNRSLARSKIKRDGLKASTRAPDFRLPRLDGRGELSLEEFRGRRVLLVFSSPNCGPCNGLAPELEKFHREQEQHKVGRAVPCAPPGDETFQNGAHGVTRPTVAVVMISKGEPKENRAKVKEHGLTFPVVLQQQWEISRRYAMFATPIAYLIDEQGVIVNDVAVGVEAILELIAAAVRTAPASGRLAVSVDSTLAAR